MNLLEKFDQLLVVAYTAKSQEGMIRFLDSLSRGTKEGLRLVEITDTEQGITRKYLTHTSFHANWFHIDTLIRRMRSGTQSWEENFELGMRQGADFFPVILVAEEGAYTFSEPRSSEASSTLIDFLESGLKECALVWTHGGAEHRSLRRTYESSIPDVCIQAVRPSARGVLYVREMRVDKNGDAVGWRTSVLLITVTIGSRHGRDCITAKFRHLTNDSSDPEMSIGPSTRGLDDRWKRLIKKAKKFCKKNCSPLSRERIEWLVKNNWREFERQYRQYRENRSILPSLIGTLNTLPRRLKLSGRILWERLSQIIDQQQLDYRACVRSLLDCKKVGETLDTIKEDWQLLVFIEEFIWKPSDGPQNAPLAPISFILETTIDAYALSPERRAILMAMAKRFVMPLNPYWD